MTREQLIKKRKIKKRIRLGLYGAAALAVLIILITAVRAIANRPRKRSKPKEETSSEVAPVEVASADNSGSDSAGVMTVKAGMTGDVGWNLDDNGWWYKNEDDTVFSGGWKTIDGQK